MELSPAHRAAHLFAAGTHAAPPQAACLHLLLTVWPQGCAGNGSWRARAQLNDGSEHHFSSPFELARFVARAPSAPDTSGNGLR